MIFCSIFCSSDTPACSQHAGSMWCRHERSQIHVRLGGPPYYDMYLMWVDNLQNRSTTIKTRSDEQASTNAQHNGPPLVSWLLQAEPTASCPCRLGQASHLVHAPPHHAQVNLNSTSNCGACRRACPVPPHTVATCSSGDCSFTCSTGYANCDGNPGNGCEVRFVLQVEECVSVWCCALMVGCCVAT